MDKHYSGLLWTSEHEDKIITEPVNNFDGRVFPTDGRHTYGYKLCSSSRQLIIFLFLYSYHADFIQVLLKKNEKKLARSFNFTFRDIDDVLSLNNYRFGDLVDRIYPIELEIKDTTDTDKSA